VMSAFTPRGVAQLRTEIEELTDSILSQFEESGDDDFINTVAFPLPASVISILLGASSDTRADMQNWSRNLGSLVMGKLSRDDAWHRAMAAAEEMQIFFTQLIEHYRKEPADNLVTRMIEAADKEGDLSPERLVGACSLLLFGGHETTTSLISSCVYQLSQDEELRARLLADPTLIASFVEEVLRFNGPSKILVRRARRDWEWRGQHIRAGQPIYCSVAAANRDSAQFPDPDRFIVDRTPNRHLAFGFGRHFCLGAQLARLETQIVIAKILQRFPNIHVSCEPDYISWQPTIVGRTLRSLPVAIN
jgi:cytochrome P450